MAVFNRFRQWGKISFVLFIVVLALHDRLGSLSRNLLFLNLLPQNITQPLSVDETARLQQIVRTDCRVNWQYTLYATVNSLDGVAQETQEKMMQCSLSMSETLLTTIRGADRFTEQVILLYPTWAEGWLRVGDIVQRDSRPAAELYFVRAVELDPAFGLAWCRLGGVREDQYKIDQAFEAYQQCCYYSDPGNHGCYGAGRMMEKLGNKSEAIRYYLLSRWSTAHDRADELESNPLK